MEFRNRNELLRAAYLWQVHSFASTDDAFKYAYDRGKINLNQNYIMLSDKWRDYE